jgi:tape measure domain-containing protein
VSVVANVAINVDSSGAVSKLRQVQQGAQATSQAVDKLNASAAATSDKFKSAGSGASALASSLGRLAAAYFTLQTAQRAVQAGIQREESTRRLTFLAQGYNEIAQAQEAAARAGRQFGLSTTESNQQFAQLYGRLRPLNVSLTDIESAFIGFNTAAKVSGATAAESSGALLQLTQALGSGVLRGQELNSVLEQAPGLVVALTKELGAPISQIRKLAEEGKITSDVVIRALKRAGSEGADELAEAMNGPAQQVKNLQNAFEDLQVTISRVFSPAVKAAIDGITTRAIDLNSGVERTALAFQFAANKLAPLLNGLEQLRWYFVNLTPPGWAMQVIGGSSNLAGNLIRGAAVAQKLETNATLAGGRYLEPGQQVNFMPRRPQPAAPPPMGGSAGSGRSRGGESAAEKAAREAERAAEAAAKEAARVKDVIRDRLAEGQLISVKSELQDRIAAAEAASDKMLVARLQSQERELEIQYRYAQELTKEADLNAQKAIIYEGLNALTANQIALQRELDALQDQSDQDRLTALQKYIEKQYELNSSVQNQLQLANGVANTLGEGLGSAFNALIAGAQGWEKSLQQIASGVLVDIANQLIRIFVVEQAINAIKTFLTPFSSSTPLGAGGGTVGKFGTLGPNYGIPQRANGGSVAGGSPYIVGERGPELFVPGRSGTIVPNDKMGGGGNVSVVVNVDASGSNVEGDAEDSKQLGRVIAAAIQQELVKQKRPGGLLA